MNILLNTESLHPPLTGIGNYTLNLLRHLPSLPGVDQIECFSGTEFFTAEHAVSACVQGSAKSDQQQGVTNGFRLRSLLRRVPGAYRARAAMHAYALRRQAERRRSYLYHEPNFILKPHDGPCVTTIHDLSFIHYPQHHPAERVAWIGGQLPKTLERADLIITPSEIIRRELVDDMGIAPERVQAIHLGASEQFHPRSADDTAQFRAPHGLRHKGYILFVASLEPRKGIDVLLDAWCALPTALREHWPLVLAGAPGWKNQELQARIDTLSQTHGLKHLRYVSNEDLYTLYAGAGLFVYPSLYEGFGLPVLEAMRSGVPVITSQGTSMAEFAADCGLLVDPSNSGALAAEMERILADQITLERMTQMGLAKASEFTWQRCASRTLDAYRTTIELAR
ncbi:glycosyltransferase family 4 protein [Pseudomonas sp. Marseille-QA0892]